MNFWDEEGFKFLSVKVKWSEVVIFVRSWRTVNSESEVKWCYLWGGEEVLWISEMWSVKICECENIKNWWRCMCVHTCSVCLKKWMQFDRKKRKMHVKCAREMNAVWRKKYLHVRCELCWTKHVNEQIKHTNNTHKIQTTFTENEV